MTRSRHIGVVATAGTIKSESYPLEIRKLFPDITVTGEACPMWVPLVENNEATGDGADFFIRKNLNSLLGKDPQIDAIILGCTHYPLIEPLWQSALGPGVKLMRIETAVARRAADLWRPEAGEAAALAVETSGAPERLQAWMAAVLGWRDVNVEGWTPESANGQQSLTV